MFAGFSQLLLSDSYYVAYLLVFVAAAFCLRSNARRLVEGGGRLPERRARVLAWVFSIAFALMVTLANYRLWDAGLLRLLVLGSVIFFGALCAFGNVLVWAAANVEALAWHGQEVRWRPGAVFTVMFATMATVNLLVLFLCNYPGNLTTDNIAQLTQVFTGVYTNHHPFYHTLVIKACVDAGLALFGDINAAVALYSTVSVLFMAATFAFATSTLCELGAPKPVVVLVGAFFVLMPYHVMYSMTMWKDVPFGAFVLLFVLLFFRCQASLGHAPANYAGLALVALGMCLFRSNGYFVLALVTLGFLLLWRLSDKRVLLLLLGVLVCGFVLKHPVLEALGVTQPDVVESLSIPVQQVARDVVDHDDWSEEDTALLNEVVDVERVPEVYNPSISDPIKDLVRERDNEDYLASHAGDYLALYLGRLARHPFTYLKAWVDETRGYWNGGYDYWRWSDGVRDNDLGVVRTVRSRTANALVDGYLAAFENLPALQTFLCIGLFDWLALGALFVSAVRRDRVGVMLSLPVLLNVLSLLVATPVFSEFRYDYAVFCALPVIAVLVLRPSGMVRRAAGGDEP